MLAKPAFRSHHLRIAAIALAAVAIVWTSSPYTHLRYSRPPVDFGRDIRPIFNQNCTTCHGGVRQKNGVSFIFREDALGIGKSGRPTIVPGNPDASELIARISSKDPETRMPYHAPSLPTEQIALLRRWIKEGAKWSDYWAFVPPKPSLLPAVKQTSWVRRPEDRFILARLEQESLKPSPEAKKAELLRRVSLDLTGLPPTEQEMSSYLADSSPDAYEKAVDRLLASPGYGERWTSLWLDLARYADTKGYEADRRRPGVWPYRDWVIEAFNRNVPYDQFVITQIAGDLLPNPTFEDRIATSFHRQTPNNEEGGTDDEEFRLIAVMDRSATTWSVLNGVTMNCVQCHSHPYDPIRHTDYYKSLAFFNTSYDADRDDDAPTLRVPKDRSRNAEASHLQKEIADLIHSQENSDREVVEKTQWKPLPIQSASANEVTGIPPVLTELHQALEKLKKRKIPLKSKIEIRKDLLYQIAAAKKRLAYAQALGAPEKTFHIRDGEAIADSNTPPQSFYELTSASILPVATAIRIEVPPLDAEKARHTPENGFIVDEVHASTIQPNGRKDKIVFRCFIHDSEQNLTASILKTTGSGKPSPSKVIADGFEANPKLDRTRWIVGVFATPQKLAPDTRIEVAFRQSRSIDSKPAIIQRVRVSVSGDRSWAFVNQDTVRAIRMQRLCDLESILTKIPAVDLPVMLEEQPYERRPTLEFERGNFLSKTGLDLVPDVPAIFPKLPDGAPRNRLTLAKWFFAPGQPLTARVAVNRYWEQLFGTGIVETLENFGSVGEPPSHPELLDWLALHFQNDLHWDMKALLRELVASATYRQSAISTPELREKDPRNRLLARGPQQRLTAEMVRDQALTASGLLNRTMGQPPVMPPQPAGVWKSVYNDDRWKDDRGPNRYRRAIYTFVKRTSGYPSFLTFDSSDRHTSLARRIPTNTPLQALVTLNDPVYQEAAEALAKRVLKEATLHGPVSESAGDILDARLSYATRLVLSRDPTPAELRVLQTFLQKTFGNSNRPPLREVRLEEGGIAQSDESTSTELQRYTAVASLLFNLDAALTR